MSLTAEDSVERRFILEDKGKIWLAGLGSRKYVDVNGSIKG
jgi:hypothetical protein